MDAIGAPSGPVARGRRRLTTELDIEAAALAELETLGFEQLTMERIATAAGVSVRTAFRYFPTKVDTLLHTARRVAEVMDAALAASLEADGGMDLWIGLNDRIADGRDVSWIWDADFELLAGAVRRVVCGGTRAPEMALRLKYAGWPVESIEVCDGIGPSFDRAVDVAGGRLFALPTYTALMELHRLLAGRGLAKEFWR